MNYLDFFMWKNQNRPFADFMLCVNVYLAKSYTG